jgi:hypothetical protein
MTEPITGLALLRVPFLPNQISKLPKPFSKDSPKQNCKECGGYHGMPAMHLDYVGHAALTDRLLEADPAWSWEPLSLGPDGLPAIDREGGMWIKLTVCGVTRLGYGDAQGKTGGNAMKERIGDALRNAAMRFGAALDLWHKGDLHAEEEPPKPAKAAARAPVITPTSGVMLDMQRTSVVIDTAEAIKERMAADDVIGAYELYLSITEDDEKVYLWKNLPSNIRAAIKKHGETLKAPADKSPVAA